MSVEMQVLGSDVDDEYLETDGLLDDQPRSAADSTSRGCRALVAGLVTFIQSLFHYCFLCGEACGSLFTRVRDLFCLFVAFLALISCEFGSYCVYDLRPKIYRLAFGYVFGTRYSVLMFFLNWIKYWSTKLNYKYCIFGLIVLEMFTGLVYISLLIVMDVSLLFIQHTNLRCLMLLLFTYLLVTNKIFTIWLFTIVRFLTWRDQWYDFKGISKLIRSTGPGEDDVSSSHPECCKLRNRGTEICKAVARKFGCRPYFISKSRRVHSSGAVGSTYSFNLDVSPANDPHLFRVPSDEPSEMDMICMVDRDYYYNMNDVFMLGRPVCIYTFDPDVPCTSDNEYCFRFQEDGRVVGSVDGGSRWEHPLWEYPDDIMTISQYGICYSYKVLKYKFAWRTGYSNRSLMIFKPIGATFSLSDNLLKYRNHVSGKSVVMHSFSRNGKMTWISSLGSYDYVLLDGGEWERLVADVIARSTKPGVVKVSLPAIEEFLKKLGWEDEEDSTEEKVSVQARTIYQCLSTLDYSSPYDYDTKGYYVSIEYEVQEKVRELKALVPEDDEEFFPPTAMFINSSGRGYEEDPKSGMISLAPEQLCGNAMVPARTVINMETCVYNRKTLPQIEMMEGIDDDAVKDLLPFIDEFIDEVVGEKKLFPVSEEEVRKRMARPSQVVDYVESCQGFYDSMNRPLIFQKAEELSSDPRPITQEHGISKWRFAAYVYAMTEVFKTFDWYAFGKCPADVAKRVAKVCCNLPEGWVLILTDYSRFDGHLSPLVRYAIKKLYTKAFGHSPDYALDLEELLEDRYFRRALADCHPGIIFLINYFEQCSGDQNTSNVGTFTNALIAYCTLRRAGLDRKRAFDSLGEYGGDDGVSQFPDGSPIVQTAKNFGQKIVAEKFVHPDHGGSDKVVVKFLARVYSPLVWHGDYNTCADISRQLSKLLITENKGVPHALKLYQKCFSHSLNDSNTPLLGEYCVAVVAIADKLGYASSIYKVKEESEEESPESIYAITKDLLSHWGTYALAYDNGFPNENEAGWMDGYVDRAMPEFDCKSFRIQLEAAIRVSNERYEESVAEHNSKGISNARKMAILSYVLQPFLHLSNFDKRMVKELKPGTDIIVRDNDDEYRITIEGKNRAPDSREDLIIPDPVPPSKVEDYEFYNRVLNGQIPCPFTILSPGARKCLAVTAHFVAAIKKEFPRGHRSAHIVYTGAYGDDLKEALEQILTLNPARIYLFDPVLFSPANKKFVDTIVSGFPPQIRRKITVRSSKYTEKDLLDVAARCVKADGSYTFPMFWLDDAFSGDPKTDKALLHDKFRCVELLQDKLKFVSLKIKGDDFVETKLQGLSYYHTPTGSNFFTDVKELRAFGKPIPGENKEIVRFVDVNIHQMSELEALVLLRDIT